MSRAWDTDGINDVYEIKILVCYLLNKVGKPFSKEEFNTIFDNCSSVDYFALSTAVSQLEGTGHIREIQTEDGAAFELLELGEETSRQLDSTLPAALRDKVVKSALNLLAARKLAKEREATIAESEDGFIVSCAIHDIGSDLLKMEVFAPDMISAKQLQSAFLKNTADFYKWMIGFLTSNAQSVRESIESIDTEKADDPEKTDGQEQ